MESQRNFLLIGLLLLSAMIWLQWNTDKNPAVVQNNTMMEANSSTDQDVPTADQAQKKEVIVEQDLVHVVTDTLDLKINPIGGDVVYAALKQYKVELGQDESFVMLNAEPDSTYMAQSGLIGQDGIDRSGARARYSVAQSEYQLAEDQDTLKVLLTLSKDGVNYIKEFTFERGHYDIGVRYLIENQSDRTLQMQMYAQLKQKMIEAESSMMMPTYRGGAYSNIEDRFTKYTFDDMEDANLNLSTQGGWISMIQHYFVSAWVPPQNEQHKFYTSVRRDDTANIGYLGEMVEVEPQSTQKIQAKLYVGPKDQAALSAIAEHLNLVVDYGFLWWLAVPIHALLMFFQGFVVNWGLAIILVTLTVRGLLYPLTKAQYVSMAKMRNLQPKLQSLKDRYGEDRQKMGQAMMELYRKEKVNPMGGCLPLILQMPIFIALYWVLLESVELRHAPFMLWIQDLSVQDPFYVLPILMGASMWFMQRLQPQAATLDPMQQKMMQYMPLMFTVFFLWFPSGLVLYWLVGNLVAIGQQLVIYKSLEKRGLK
tara:strand:- start:2678 stop:4291 length:1614 start_codon:yes stop_codon:yes gene_type:complete